MIKRIFAGAIAALVYAAVGATTLSPVQLINPAGSSAGQAIVSTGPTSAPAWGGVSVSGIAAIAANTVLTNATGSSASPTAFAVPSCSASGNALTWTSGTGFGCATGNALTANPLSQFAATTSAQLASVISDETGSGAAVFGTSPTLTKPNIVGTATNDSAAAGSVGEYPTPASTTGTSLTTATFTNCTSKSLSAGDWDVQSVILYTPAGTTSVSDVYAGVATTSGANGGFGSYTKNTWAAMVPANTIVLASPIVRVTLSGTTTVYAIGRGDFSVSTMTCDGLIRARRVF
jgi:hypothetical protein